MTNNELVQIVDIAHAAARFKEQLQENPYFLSKLEALKVEYLTQLSSLRPVDVDSFKELVTVLQFIPRIEAMIDDDIAAGQWAMEVMNGESTEQGML